jgi:phosphohistidine phosphatase
MDLIFWRHAEAYDPVDGGVDLERELTSRGEKQALRMAAWLDRQLPEGVRVLCSPARRTEQTVQPLNRKYKLRAELAPGSCTVDELLELAGWPNSRTPVLVVGHQPLLGQAIAHLLGMAEGELAVRKGAAWWLRSRERDGKLQTIVVSVQTPELF